MEIIYAKSFWELDLDKFDDPMAEFVARVAADGFDTTEMFLPLIPGDPDYVLQLHDEADLGRPIIDIITEGETPGDHQASFDHALRRALEFEPRLINSHTGRDIFGFDDNVDLYLHALRRSREAGVPIVHETHRFRPTYSAIETRRYLEKVPELMLNADLSHWMVVHESDLSDQPGNVDVAIQRSRHIHARVGHEEGPQVTDPRSSEWAGHVDRHIALWQAIVDACREAGVGTLAITPEFGPPPYAATEVGTGVPLVDVWEANVYMKNLLRERLV